MILVSRRCLVVLIRYPAADGWQPGRTAANGGEHSTSLVRARIPHTRTDLKKCPTRTFDQPTANEGSAGKPTASKVSESDTFGTA